MNRTEILEIANKCITGKREQDYGSPESNFQIIAGMTVCTAGSDGAIKTAKGIILQKRKY